MEKILAPADRVLAEIGRLVLARPLFYGVLLIAATIITILNNEIWEPSRAVTPLREEVIATLPPPVVSTAAPKVMTAAAEPSTDASTANNKAIKTTEMVVTSDKTTASAAKLTVAKSSAAKPQPTQSTQTTSAATAPALKYVSGRVTRSFFADAKKAGLSTKQVNQLAQLFSQKNIVQSVRPGDEFNVLYEDAKKTASKKTSANILAAQLTAKNKTYQLIRFVDPKGRVEYYNPQGQSLRDGLSRQPLQFDYISSYFSSNRLDPVLHYHRPHEGVDFAAPLGTPVQAAGDGILADAGYRGGYGNLVTIQHDTKYATRYAHLSKFAANLRPGQSVKKGQIIGYVGQTGFATGPHLHFEIRVNDVANNPLTVALPSATIPSAYRHQFLAQTKVVLAQLNTNRQIWLAQIKPVETAKKQKKTKA
jgi:murein DD-endopeptidase MepM/ murein hydrolase activator NlpD